MFEDISLAWPFAASAAESEIDLAALVELYSTLLFRVANSVVRNAAEAEDIVQDTFVRVMQHKGTLPAVGDLRVWLVRIAWNLSIDHKRRVRPEQMMEAESAGLSANAMPADRVAGDVQQLDIVMKAIDRLPNKERQALLLSAVEELDTAEIAKIMGKSESAIRALLFRARIHLRERLAAAKGAKAWTT